MDRGIILLEQEEKGEPGKEAKRRLTLDAMNTPGGIDTDLTASDLPLAGAAEELNKKDPPELEEP